VTTLDAPRSAPATPVARRALVEAGVATAFFVSGASALTFEALWFERAGLAFGNDVWASSCVLAAFMLGMAAGHAGAIRFASRLADLRVFAALELVAAVSGVTVVFGLGGVEAHFGALASSLFDHPVALNSLRVVGALLAFLVPSAAMGASLPALTGALAPRDAGYGRVLGLLYGANTAGGVAGVLLTELVFVPGLGLHATALVAAGAELAVAAVAFVAAKRLVLAEPDLATEEPARDPHRVPWLVATFFAGFALLALEVVWVRVLTLFVDDTSSAFASILAVVLAGIAAGGFGAAAWLARFPSAAAQTSRVAYVTGLAGVGGYLLYPTALQRLYVPEAPPLAVAKIAATLVLPAALGSGALFTLVSAGVRRTVGSGVVATGYAAAVNTVGSGVGSLLAGFVLLPWLGMDRAFFVLIALYGVVGVAASFGAPPRRTRWAELAVFAVVLALFPFGKVRDTLVDASARRWMRNTDRIIEVREARAGTLVHIRHELGKLTICDQIVTDAYSMTSNDFLARRYMKFFVYLPVAVEPHVGKALLLAYGMGNTAKALVDTRELEQLDVVDVSEDMLDMSRSVEPALAPHPLDDPRVHVHVGDARYFLRSTSEEYDLITGEPPPPVMAHVASLYTTEYFSLVRDRLREGGMVTYWLPTMNLSAAAARSLIRGFCDAFPDCSLWNGAKENFVLVGSRGTRATVDDARFVAQWRDPAVVPELRNVGLEFPGQLGAMFIGDSSYLDELTHDDAPLTDDFPRRINVKGERDERLDLVGQWRDTKAARGRFESSALIAGMFPLAGRKLGAQQFENERLMNDLTFNGPTRARQIGVLDQVLSHTPLRVPPLLLLGSDPDFQRALASVPSADRHQPALAKHEVARALAVRDAKTALQFIHDVPEASLIPPGLTSYVEGIVREDANAPATHPN
jgi:spermidine synthase